MVAEGLTEEHVILGWLSREYFGGVSGLSVGSMEVVLFQGEIDGFVEVYLHLVNEDAVCLALSLCF